MAYGSNSLEKRFKDNIKNYNLTSLFDLEAINQQVENLYKLFGIDISYVDNIVRMQKITRVPNVAPYIKGVINLRGEIIPIMSLRLKMGLEEAEETKDCQTAVNTKDILNQQSDFRMSSLPLFTLIHVLDQTFHVFRFMGNQLQLIDDAVGKDGCHG